LLSAGAIVIENTMHSIPGTDLGEDVDALSKVENGISVAGAPLVLTERKAKLMKQREQILMSILIDPVLNLELGAQLGSPSYNSVTFDLT